MLLCVCVCVCVYLVQGSEPILVVKIWADSTVQHLPDCKDKARTTAVVIKED